MAREYIFKRSAFDADQLALDIEDALGFTIFGSPQEASLFTRDGQITFTHQLRDLTDEEVARLQNTIEEHIPRPYIYKGNFSRLITRYAPSTGRILVKNDETGEERFATGFIYRKRDCLITAAHVVEKMKWTVQAIEFGTTRCESSLSYYDLKRDIAVLRLDREIRESPIRVRFRLTMPRDLGMGCVAIGYPNIPGMEPSPSIYELSIVSVKQNYIMGQKLFEMSTHLGSGMSGAPVLNNHLSLVGMVIGYPGEDGPWPKWTPVAVTYDEICSLDESLFL